MLQVGIVMSHGIHDYNWRCPICGIRMEDLIHTRKNGVTYNGVQEHHFGKNPKEDYDKYLRSETILICYKCNIIEPKWRKKLKKDEALNLEEMKKCFNLWGHGK